jgi:DNA polymerase-1
MNDIAPAPIQLVLVDGSSYLFRAFHALPPLLTSRGQHTGAIKGVINMIRSLVKAYPDSHIAVVFDAKGKTFRNDIYADYKAHRPPMPDELRSQIEPIHAIIRAMGLPMLVIEGVEADDVIGTLATQATQRGIRTLISTGDKDLAQLVSPQVTLLNTMSNEFLDAEGVTAKFGLPPERIVEYLALTGDKADNIPGVAGVGPKTAVKWLQEYGSLEGLLAHKDEVSGKIGERLRESLDTLWLSHELATIKCDVPLQVDIEDLVHTQEDANALLALYSELEFKSWVKEVEGKARSQSPASAEGSHLPSRRARQRIISMTVSGATAATAVLDEEGLDACVSALRKAGRFALALETDDRHFMETEIVGIALATVAGHAWYIPVAHDSLEFPPQLDRARVLSRSAAGAGGCASSQAGP